MTHQLKELKRLWHKLIHGEQNKKIKKGSGRWVPVSIEDEHSETAAMYFKKLQPFLFIVLIKEYAHMFDFAECVNPRIIFGYDINEIEYHFPLIIDNKKAIIWSTNKNAYIKNWKHPSFDEFVKASLKSKIKGLRNANRECVI